MSTITSEKAAEEWRCAQYEPDSAMTRKGFCILVDVLIAILARLEEGRQDENV